MRLRLWHRLFLALAGVGVAAVLAFAGWQLQYFQRGFLDYLNQLSAERLAAPAQQLGVDYARQGSWDFARGDELALMRALRMAPPEEEMRVPPPPPPGAPPLRRPPPMRPAGPLDLASRLLLLDAENRPVSGNPQVPRDVPSLPIISEGRVVGRLLLQPLPRLHGDIDVAFAGEQWRHAWIVAAAILLAALVAAWALARWLLAPIQALRAGSRALAAGQYDTKLDASRSDELGSLADDFNRLAAALAANRHARQQWGADIAHELRTPLSILRGEIQALQDGVRAPGPDTLASLQSECERLSALVEDLYQLALSDAGALSYRFEPLDLAALLREVTASHTGALQAAGLSLGVTLPTRLPLARGDHVRLQQLFGNLLQNALRYTDAPGQVRVSAAADDGAVRVVVEDSAPGVPASAYGQLFDRLYRVDASRSRAAGGAGLGLSIARAIVEAHGGDITASGSPLGGLRVCVRLPGAT